MKLFNRGFLGLLLLIPIVTTAQNAKQIRDFFWGPTDPYSKPTTIPTKYENESAVVIYKYDFYDYHESFKNVTYTSAARRQVKILDAAALKEFSDFKIYDGFRKTYGFFSSRKGSVKFGVRIFKKDGSIVEIDTEKEAKKVDDEKIIAIRNLEIGDIIDFYYYGITPFTVPYYYVFDAEEETLTERYPTLNFKLAFNTENDFFINFQSVNGAPELKRTDDGKSSERSYELTATDLPKADFPKWFFPLLELPAYKFQVCLAQNQSAEEGVYFIHSKSERDIKSSVTQEEIQDFFNKRIRPIEATSVHKSSLKGLMKGDTDRDYVEALCKYYRTLTFGLGQERDIAAEAKIDLPMVYSMVETLENKYDFRSYMMYFLNKKDIPYTVIVGLPRYDGKLEDNILTQNFEVFLRVDLEKPIYLYSLSPFALYSSISPMLENTKAYALKTKNKTGKIAEMTTAMLPALDSKLNFENVDMTVTPQADFQKFDIVCKTSSSGHLKTENQYSTLPFYEYIQDDYNDFEKDVTSMTFFDKKKLQRFKKEMQSLVDKKKVDDLEQMKNEVSKYFEIPLLSFERKFIEKARDDFEKPYIYEDSFTVGDKWVKKAGENIVFELGKLIAGQIEIQEKERKRTANIYMPYARTYEFNIRFVVPDGYEVKGFDKFNKSIENETGGFVSSAILEGNTIVLKAKKYYNKNYEPAANWPKMVAFIEAAFQTTQEKILLKKK